MDKKVILAVAGSGKTRYILERLSLDKRALIITYTVNNTANLRKGVIAKFGYLPNNIRIVTYFTFLHSFCYKPLLATVFPAKGILFAIPPAFTRQLPRTNDLFYVTSSRYLYNNRLAKLLEQKEVLAEVNERLQKYHDELFIDEIQDFAGHDFNLLKSMAKAHLPILFVGDFYQHTFDTSSDGNLNTSLHNDYKKYCKEFTAMGITVDTTTLQYSYRCSENTCTFIREHLKIDIRSNRTDPTSVVKVNNQADADRIFNDPEIVKLFYKEHYSYPCYSENWGSSKGQDHYESVCVVLYKGGQEKFEAHTLNELPPSSLNKLYVACSRARGDLYFVPETLFAKYKKITPKAPKEKADKKPTKRATPRRTTKTKTKSAAKKN
ncbi:MAG: AAA family ATPase [Bacteroidota bacterium]